jgi:hypothetical protein
MKPGSVVRLNSRELQVLDGREGWAFTIRIKGWLRPRLEVEHEPVPTRPDPGRGERKTPTLLLPGQGQAQRDPKEWTR